jgi:phosphotriesterase-related protein
MTKKIVTVLGEISPDNLGITLPHEHLLWDQSCWAHDEPYELWLREQYRQPVMLENRGHVVYHSFNYRDNLCQTDLQVAVEEAMKFKMAGGGTICDVSPVGLGRDPKALFKIALATGLNIIMGSAFYVSASWTEQEKQLSEVQIKQHIIDEFINGVEFPRIKPGILGEVGISNIRNPLEIKSLRASGMAQRELGCPLLIHTPIWEQPGNEILDRLENVGADLRKVALSHLDPTMEDYDYADSLAKRGAYIVYDQFGMYLKSYEGPFIPSDDIRIKTIKEQIRRGNLKNILISHDVCFKICLTKWGGHGYGHILENIVPRLLEEGVTEEQINTITIENPKRFLCW